MPHRFLIGFFLFVFAAVAGLPAFAQGISPVRVVFDGGERTAIVTIVNGAQEERAYRLGWRPLRMTETIALEYAEGEATRDLKPAAGMIDLLPDRLVLGPGKSGVVELNLRLPGDLPPGEYRSHLWVYPEEAEAPAEAPAGIHVTVHTGFTIPVFVRVGALKAKAGLSGFEVIRKGKSFIASFTLGREGERSLYGDLHFFCDGRPSQVIRGLAVYTEVTERHLQFELPVAAGGEECRVMGLEYIAPEDDRLFRGGVMARSEAEVL